MQKYISIIITITILLSSHAIAEKNKIYPDLQSFKKALYIGVMKEKNIDINNDGKLDYVVYSNGGDGTYVDILLTDEKGLVHLHVPAAESYQLIGKPGHYELQVGFGTFPQFGDIHGSDRYLWYDFYQVIGTSFVIQNSKHPEVYKKMIEAYRSRIEELEKEIEQLKKQKIANGQGANSYELINQLRRDHIAKYIEFIDKATEIIEK